MADEDQDQGENTEENSEGGTKENGDSEGKVELTESRLAEIIKSAVDEGAKRGRADSHSHFQSVADKAIKAANDTSLSEVEELREQLEKRMTPEERADARMDRIERAVTNSPSSESGEPSLSTETEDDLVVAQQSQTKKEAEAILTEAGLDIGKIDFDGDLKKFLSEIVSETKESEKRRIEKERDDEDKDADKNGVDTKRGGGGSTIDLKTVDTMALIRKGAEERQRK